MKNENGPKFKRHAKPITTGALKTSQDLVLFIIPRSTYIDRVRLKHPHKNFK